MPAFAYCMCCAVCCKQLREKLSEYQAENSLLGTLVKELKVRKRQQGGP